MTHDCSRKLRKHSIPVRAECGLSAQISLCLRDMHQHITHSSQYCKVTLPGFCCVHAVNESSVLEVFLPLNTIITGSETYNRDLCMQLCDWQSTVCSVAQMQSFWDSLCTACIRVPFLVRPRCMKWVLRMNTLNWVTCFRRVSQSINSDVTRNFTLGGLKPNRTNSFLPLPLPFPSFSSSLSPRLFPLPSFRSWTP